MQADPNFLAFLIALVAVVAIAYKRDKVVTLALKALTKLGLRD